MKSMTAFLTLTALAVVSTAAFALSPPTITSPFASHATAAPETAPPFDLAATEMAGLEEDVAVTAGAQPIMLLELTDSAVALLDRTGCTSFGLVEATRLEVFLAQPPAVPRRMVLTLPCRPPDGT